MKYVRPETVEAAALAVSEGAIPLGGGTLLVPEIARCQRMDQTFVDLGRLSALSLISKRDNSLQVGSMVTLDRLETITAQRSTRAISQAARAVGNPQVRRAGTLGGNIAAGTPTTDVFPALLALDAQVLSLHGKEQETSSIATFSGSGHLITSVILPVDDTISSSFRKFAWRHSSGLTLANISTALWIAGGMVTRVRIVVGGISSITRRLERIEQLLTGRKLADFTEPLLNEAAAFAAKECISDLPAPPSHEYRRELVSAGVHATLAEAAWA
jgi:CO/xanthine dehydrogenase FAD-binding subunit